MKKKIIATLLSITMLCSFSSCAGNTNTEPQGASAEAESTETRNETSAFRNSTWGMSMNAVVELEGRDPDYQKDSEVVYKNVKVGTKAASAVYTFEDDSLIRGAYIIDETHVNGLKYLDDYNELKDTYIEKYGTPLSDDQEWSDKTFEKDLEYSLMFGYVKYLTMWLVDDTSILLLLSGDNGDIHFYVYYTDETRKENKDTNGV